MLEIQALNSVVETKEELPRLSLKVDSFEQIRVNISSMAQKSKPWEVTTSELHSQTNMQFPLSLLGTMTRYRAYLAKPGD